MAVLRRSSGRPAKATRRLRCERLEERRALAAIVMAAEEQLLLELVNRARANPAGEAARYGIDLNAGLPAGAISPAPKQPLAPHPALLRAAGDHADDMLARDYFDHINPRGQDPSDRARAAGYPGNAGENISWGGSTLPIDELAHVYERHRSLFLSPGHRANLLLEAYADVGAGVRYGLFAKDGVTYHASMVAESFGSAVGGQITGVAFTDGVTDDGFYDVGEGLANLTITAHAADGTAYVAQSGPSGGFALAAPPGVYTLTVAGGPLAAPLVQAGVRHGLDGFSNTKVDFDTSVPRPNRAWHNAARPADVDDSGTVTVADLLAVVAYLRANAPGPLPPVAGKPVPGYVDVNGDGEATVADLVAAVAHLRSLRTIAAAEGEDAAARTLDDYFAQRGDDEGDAWPGWPVPYRAPASGRVASGWPT